LKSTYDKTRLCPQFFCTVFAGNLLGVCTCFFASACAILKMEKTEALNGPIQSHLFLLSCVPHPLKF